MPLDTYSTRSHEKYFKGNCACLCRIAQRVQAWCASRQQEMESVFDVGLRRWAFYGHLWHVTRKASQPDNRICNSNILCGFGQRTIIELSITLHCYVDSISLLYRWKTCGALSSARRCDAFSICGRLPGHVGACACLGGKTRLAMSTRTRAPRGTIYSPASMPAACAPSDIGDGRLGRRRRGKGDS